MVKKKKSLCDTCREIRDSKALQLFPRHLVHPVDRKPGLFDTWGRAMCPVCEHLWQRDGNTVRLVE